MRKRTPVIRIGTSGWVYPHWDGLWYPEDVPQKKQLAFISRQFPTVEVNMTHKRFPTRHVLQNWDAATPEGFCFSFKVHRSISHERRLKGVKRLTRTFVKLVQLAGDKCGPLLFQFPSFFKPTEEHIARLEKFLEDFRSIAPTARAAFEFRGAGWDHPRVIRALRRSHAALVAADSSRYPYYEVQTADFMYLRLHGPRALFGSRYTKKELATWAEKILAWKKRGLDVYVYFNNDMQAFAPKNALELIRLCTQP